MTTRTEPLLTTQQVADMLAVTPATVRYLIRNEGLPAHRVGRQLRFDAAAVQRWLEQDDRP